DPRFLQLQHRRPAGVLVEGRDRQQAAPRPHHLDRRHRRQPRPTGAERAMSRLTRLLKRSERGATLVEFAFIFTFLLMLAIGAFEYGMALRDWQSVTIATREGARVAASAANYQAADCTILEATAGALQSFRVGNIDFVTIYKSDEDGTFPGSGSLAAVYRPAGSGDTPVPECPFWTVHSAASDWQPDDRLNVFGEPYWIGVRLEYSDPWQTNFLFWTGSAQWTDDAVFRIEPPPPNI